MVWGNSHKKHVKTTTEQCARNCMEIVDTRLSFELFRQLTSTHISASPTARARSRLERLVRIQSPVRKARWKIPCIVDSSWICRIENIHLPCNTALCSCLCIYHLLLSRSIVHTSTIFAESQVGRQNETAENPHMNRYSHTAFRWGDERSIYPLSREKRRLRHPDYQSPLVR